MNIDNEPEDVTERLRALCAAFDDEFTNQHQQYLRRRIVQLIGPLKRHHTITHLSLTKSNQCLSLYIIWNSQTDTVTITFPINKNICENVVAVLVWITERLMLNETII